MSRDLRELLRDTAVGPTRPVDATDIARRARRRTWSTRAAIAVLSVLVVAGATVGVRQAVDVSQPPEIVDQPSAVPEPTPPADDAARMERVTVDPAIDEAVSSGAAITSGFGSVWLAGPSRLDTDAAQREYAEVVRAAPDASAIEATVDVGQPMTELVATDDAVWVARAGDGALPDNLLVRIDPGTNQADPPIDLGDFSTVAMAALDDGDLVLLQRHEPALMWVDGSTGATRGPVSVEGVNQITDAGWFDGKLVITSSSGRLAVFEDATVPAVAGAVVTPDRIVADLDGDVRAVAATGSGMWTARTSPNAVALTAWDGQTLADIELSGTPASITAAPDAPTTGSDAVAYLALGDGGLLRVTAAGALAEVGTTGGSVRAVLQDGAHVWVLAEDLAVYRDPALLTCGYASSRVRPSC